MLARCFDKNDHLIAQGELEDEGYARNTEVICTTVATPKPQIIGSKNLRYADSLPRNTYNVLKRKEHTEIGILVMDMTVEKAGFY